MKFKLFLLVLLFLSFYITDIDCKHQEHPWEEKKLIIGSEPDYPPFCIINKAGKASGFSVDLIKAVCEEMDLEYSIKIAPWHQIKNDLKNGDIDVLPLVSRSKERDKYFDFTFPYHSMRGAIFVNKKNTDIKNDIDLKNKKILVMRNDTAHEYLIHKNITDSIILTNTFLEAFKLLNKGSYDVVVAQHVMGLQIINNYNLNNIKVVDTRLTGFSQDFAFAVKDGNKKLLSKLNEGLSIIIANGTYDEIHSKWWSPAKEIKFNLKEKLIILLPIILIIFFVFAISMIIALKIRVKNKTQKLKLEVEKGKLKEKELKLTNKELNSAIEDKKVLMKEIHHRVKNNLMNVANLLKHQIMLSEDDKINSVLKDSVNRVNAMITIHKKIYQTEQMKKISLSEYVDEFTKELVFAYQNSDNRVMIKKNIDKKIRLDFKKIEALALILNELITNSLKYAFKDDSDNEIYIGANLKNNLIKIVFQDNGVGIPDEIYENKSSTLGLYLIKNLVKKQLDGKIIYKNGKGSKFEIEFII